MQSRGHPAVVGTLVPTMIAGLVWALGAGSAAQDVQVAAPARGGSNYNFYALKGCAREPYGVINRFDAGRKKITKQLRAMRRDGQQRLRIGVYHYHGRDTGTVMNSTGGNLAKKNRKQLARLLAAVRRAHFAEIEVAFHPIGANDPAGWASFQEATYQENWNLIRALRPIIARARVHYRIDLMNEGAPAPNQPVLREYTRRLWADYTRTFGKSDTVGFSVIAETARITQLPAVYGDNPPYLFDLHFYDEEYRRFRAAHDAMNGLGYRQGWIIGEAYYNDAAAAADLRRASLETGRQIYYLTQWPITRARQCDDVDRAPPEHFGNYARQGF